MSRPSLRLGLAGALIALLAMFVGAASASAAQLVTNGDFESGTLQGWQTSYETEEGEWFAYSAKEHEEEGVGPFPPPSGQYTAADQFHFPDSAILYQEFTIPPATTDQLSMYLGYLSFAPISVPSSDRLTVGTGPEEDQQLRVDILKAGAPIRSLAGTDILKTIYASKNGDPQELEPTVLTADLSQFAGQTVMLRVANVVEVNFMYSIVDGVSVESTPIATPPAPVVLPPSNVFTKGKLTLNKKNGTGFISVTLPEAGILTAVDARRHVAVASLAATTGKKKPVLIKTARVASTGAQTVKVPIKATAAGMKLLKEKGKLAFKLQLTFAPTGGTPATQSFAGKLAKRLKPTRRR